jgi:hypothetical protein
MDGRRGARLTGSDKACMVCLELSVAIPDEKWDYIKSFLK